MAVENPFTHRVTELNYPISFSDMNIEVDSTDNDVTLILPSQRELYAFQQKAGYYNNIFNGFSITWVAGANPVKVITNPDDIGFTPNLPEVALVLGGSAKFVASSNGGWSYFFSGLGGSTAKVFNGLVTQIGVQDPTIIVLENTFGFVPALKYVAVGTYATVVGVHPLNAQKAMFRLGNNNLQGMGTVDSIEYVAVSPINGILGIITKDKAVKADGILSNTPIWGLYYP